MRRPFEGVPGLPQLTAGNRVVRRMYRLVALEADSSVHIFRYHLTISIATLASITASCTVLHALMPSQFVPTIHGHGM